MSTSGPPNASVMIVGESWGRYEDEDPSHSPFIGPSGWELNRMLAEAGFARSQIFCANVVNARPPKDKVNQYFFTKTQARKSHVEQTFGLYPNEIVRSGLDRLRHNLDRVKPRLVIALGNVALWALTGGSTRRPDEKSRAPTGILRWRGSELDNGELHDSRGWICLPTVHPAAVLREWGFRNIVVQDLRRAKRMLERGIVRPAWSFTVRPTLETVREFTRRALALRADGGPISVDIETRGGQIATVGYAINRLEAISVPFMCVERSEGYWTINEELEVTYLLKSLLTASLPGPVIFQNGAYDLQYFAKQFGFLPAITDDTMLMQHTLFPGLRKGLDFLSSLYCEYHRYWKDDGKNWDPSTGSEDVLWRYNCEDCVRTLEIWEVLHGLINGLARRPQYDFQMRLLRSAVRMMLRGIKIDLAERDRMVAKLTEMQQFTQRWLNTALDRDFNPNSNPQMLSLFYEELGCRVIKKRTSDGWTPTCEDEALQTIARRDPLLVPLTNKIREFRSIQKFRRDYAEMLIPPDGRMRSTINLTGTETYRFSMSEDAFGYGGNLQTLPKGTEDE